MGCELRFNCCQIYIFYWKYYGYLPFSFPLLPSFQPLPSQGMFQFLKIMLAYLNFNTSILNPSSQYYKSLHLVLLLNCEGSPTYW